MICKYDVPDVDLGPRIYQNSIPVLYYGSHRIPLDQESNSAARKIKQSFRPVRWPELNLHTKKETDDRNLCFPPSAVHLSFTYEAVYQATSRSFVDQKMPWMS